MITNVSAEQGNFKTSHYENLPMQYIENFSVPKIENFTRKMLIFFLFLLKT